MDIRLPIVGSSYALNVKNLAHSVNSRVHCYLVKLNDFERTGMLSPLVYQPDAIVYTSVKAISGSGIR